MTAAHRVVIMKAILASVLVPLLAQTALAKPAAPPPARPAPPPAPAKKASVDKLGKLDKLDRRAEVDEVSKLDLGFSYGLKQRAADVPEPDAETFEAHGLKDNQVGAIVRERAEDLEYCWLRLPRAKRVVSAAILHLSIEASGKVATVEVNGDLPAGVGKCITTMANRWTFPAADVGTEIDHGIMLTTVSQKVR